MVLCSEAQGIGIGSTGGGVVIEGYGELDSITPKEFQPRSPTRISAHQPNFHIQPGRLREAETS